LTSNKAIIALGADIKNRVAAGRGTELYAGEDIQDLAVRDNFKRFVKNVDGIVRKTGKPGIAAFDMHPLYFSSIYAKEKFGGRGTELFPVQHHHAHIASVMFEHKITAGIIAVAFDGTGYGTDGNIWGGEFFWAKGGQFVRAAHLKYMKMPGGDKVVSEPWRMVYGILGRKAEGLLRKVPARDKDIVLQMLEKSINCPLSSGAGRIFDAAAALLGLVLHAKFEAEGPIMLEKVSKDKTRDTYEYAVKNDGEIDILDVLPVFTGIIRDMKKGKEVSFIGSKFHNTIVNMIVKEVRRLAGKLKTRNAVLSGGVFQNTLIMDGVMKGLEDAGLKVYTNNLIPVNDLNIAYGQYYLAKQLH